MGDALQPRTIGTVPLASVPRVNASIVIVAIRSLGVSRAALPTNAGHADRNYGRHKGKNILARLAMMDPFARNV